VSGNESASGYYTQDADDNVSFFLDRVNFTDAASPSASDPLNIPGLMLGRLGENIVTVDFLWTPNTTTNEEDCTSSGGDYETSSHTCWVPTRPLKLVSLRNNTATTLSTGDLNANLEITAAIDGNDRVFLPAMRDGENVVFVMGASDNALNTSVASVDSSFNNPVLSGSSLYYLGYYDVRKVNGSNPGSASDSSVGMLKNYRPNHLSISGNTAIVSFLEGGIQALPMP
jgi:hypothetical protein